MDEKLLNILNELLGKINLLIKVDKEISKELAEVETITGLRGVVIHFRRRKFEPAKINLEKLKKLLEHIQYFIIEDNKLRSALRQFNIFLSLEKRGLEEVKIVNESHKRIFEYLVNEIEFLISHANYVHNHVQALIDLLQNDVKVEEIKDEILELDRLFRKIRIILVKIEHELEQERKVTHRESAYITRVLGVRNISKSSRYINDFDSLSKVGKIRVKNTEARLQTRPEYDKEYHELLASGVRHARYSRRGRILYVITGNTLIYERILRPEEHDEMYRVAAGLGK